MRRLKSTSEEQRRKQKTKCKTTSRQEETSKEKEKRQALDREVKQRYRAGESAHATQARRASDKCRKKKKQSG